MPSQPSVDTLRGFGAFTRVITQGRKYEKKPILAFLCVSHSVETVLRIGYCVSKKVGKATKRNRIKRLMKEAFRARKEEFVKQIGSNNLIEIVFLYIGDKGIAPTEVRFASITESFSVLCSKIERSICGNY